MQLVSIIIPNYNHAAFLQQRIESVLNQTYQDFEVILLDDCSKDDCKEIIESYRNHIKIRAIVYNERNSGSTFSQWNKGVSLAKGDIIWIAESDDMADKDFLKKLVPFFSKDKNVGLVYCQSYQYNSNSDITGNWSFWTQELGGEKFDIQFEMKGTEYINRYLIYKNTIPNASAVLFSKKIYQQIGGADATIKNCSDWLTWLKVLTVSNIIFIPELLNYFRYHENSVTTSQINNSEGIYLDKFQRKMRENFHYFLNSDSKIKNQYRDIFLKNHSLLIKEYEQEGLFEINKKNFLPGWSLILKSAFGKGIKGAVINSALKNTMKVFIK